MFLLDTTFSGVAVTASNCSSCVFRYFDPSQSSTFVGNVSATIQMTIQGVNISGYFGSDQISFKPNLTDESKLNSLEFFVITDASTLDSISGVIGLGPVGSSSLDSYTDKLASEGHVSSQVTSVLLGNSPITQPSRMTLGGPDTSAYSGSLFTYTSSDSEKWTIPMTSVALNGTDITNATFNLNLLSSWVSQYTNFSYIDPVIGNISSWLNNNSTFTTAVIDSTEPSILLSAAEFAAF
jgi:hypothetical protein